MPWHITENDADCPANKPWGVRLDDGGDLEGCHETRQDAEDQIAALHAAEATVRSILGTLLNDSRL